MENVSVNEAIERFAERWDALIDASESVRKDIKELKREINDNGLNVKAMQRLVAIRRDRSRREDEESVLCDLILYANATGTPFDVAK